MILLMALISECSSHQNLDSLRKLDHINGCGLHTRFPDARRCPHFRLHDSLIHQLLQKCTQHILYLLICYPVIKATPAPSLEPRFSVPDFVSQFKLRQIKLQQIKLRDKIRNGEPGFEATLHLLTPVSGRLLPRFSPLSLFSPIEVYSNV